MYFISIFSGWNSGNQNKMCDVHMLLVCIFMLSLKSFINKDLCEQNTYSDQLFKFICFFCQSCGCRFVATSVLNLMVFYSNVGIKRFGNELFSFSSSSLHHKHYKAKARSKVPIYTRKWKYIPMMLQWALTVTFYSELRASGQPHPLQAVQVQKSEVFCSWQCSEPQPDSRWEKYVLASLWAPLPVVILRF